MATAVQSEKVARVLGLNMILLSFCGKLWYFGSSFNPALKKDAFKWDERATEAFERLKQAMVTLTILVLPDFSLPFVIGSDAFGYGLGAILSQQQRPITYFSHTLSQQVQAKPIYELKLMAVVIDVQC